MFRRLIERLKERKLRNDPVAYARYLGVDIGEGCLLFGVTRVTFGSEPFLVKLGDGVVMGSGARFITHDGSVSIFRDEDPDIEVYAPITIGNKVFLGVNVMIMPGVTIGDYSIIGAGSIVTKDIPAGSVAVGVPAHVIRTTEEYKAKIKEKAFHIRQMPKEEKKAFLIKTLRPDRKQVP